MTSCDLTQYLYLKMWRKMSSLYVLNFNSAPSSMPKLQPIIHFPQVNSLVPGLKLLQVGKKIAELTSFIIVYRSFNTCNGRFCSRTWSDLLGTISFNLIFTEIQFKNVIGVGFVVAGTKLSFSGNFLHHKFTQLLSLSAISHRREI